MGKPPWRPDRLAATGYAAYRDVLRTLFAHADGLRIDHVAGLWRLWWVPPGAAAHQGTYVRYDHALLGLSAYRSLVHMRGAGYGEALRFLRNAPSAR